MLIKLRLFCACLIFGVVLFLPSCNTFNNKQPVYEVDLKEKTEVQLTCNQNVYNALICYNSGCLKLEFSDNGDAYDGLSFSVSKGICTTYFNGIEYDIPDGELTQALFVNELYSLISSANGVLVTEGYNENSGCSYITRRQGTHTFTFEVFENNGVFAYSLKIV